MQNPKTNVDRALQLLEEFYQSSKKDWSERKGVRPFDELFLSRILSVKGILNGIKNGDVPVPQPVIADLVAPVVFENFEAGRNFCRALGEMGFICELSRNGMVSTAKRETAKQLLELLNQYYQPYDSCPHSLVGFGEGILSGIEKGEITTPQPCLFTLFEELHGERRTNSFFQILSESGIAAEPGIQKGVIRSG
ncbi:MAG: hypothetical protein P1V20_30325 [Verrucomicrobiales bacterium]|nr:hypothetical protein [Verrucomicrobiales bacterium]